MLSVWASDKSRNIESGDPKWFTRSCLNCGNQQGLTVLARREPFRMLNIPAAIGDLHRSSHTFGILNEDAVSLTVDFTANPIGLESKPSTIRRPPPGSRLKFLLECGAARCLAIQRCNRGRRRRSVCHPNVVEILIVVVALSVELASKGDQVGIGGFTLANPVQTVSFASGELMTMPVLASISAVTCAPVTSTARCSQSGYHAG